MREILFKGKRLDNGEWAEGYLINFWGEYCIVNTDSRDICFKVDPETAGQYVGFEDIYKHKIFEGDIIEVLERRYWIADIRRFHLFINCVGKVKVIGNVHDNPELLEGKDAVQ